MTAYKIKGTSTMPKMIGSSVSIVILTGIISILFAFPVKWMWNYVMPYLFELKEVGVFQAWCLTCLCRLFFSRTEIKSGK